MASGDRGVLIKGVGLKSGSTLSIDGGTTALEPLFAVAHEGQGLDEPPQWYRAVLPSGTRQSAWDICHELVSGANALDGGGVVKFAEPDLEQRWLTGTDRRIALNAVASCSDIRKMDRDYPGGDLIDWFSDDGHSELRSADAIAGGVNARIAHLDTGLDLHHRTLEIDRVDMALARNFTGKGRPTDVQDGAGGLGEQPGHGTATHAILTGVSPDGRKLGASSSARTVPLRVADSVVLFKNSAIAKALGYVKAVNESNDPNTRIDVVTMSMGGLASQAWADAVNDLYEQGVFIVTAAGNNYGNLPTRLIVFPARFNRVVAACGVMADGTPYADQGLTRMAGNYGPKDKMTTAMAAYTPNLPWARLGCPTTVDQHGGGTSSATPQIAAAAAMWIGKNRTILNGYPSGWQRVEAVRKVLFDSATKTNQSDKLGQGTLKAKAALAIAPPAVASLVKQPLDKADFPIVRVLFGLGAEGLSDQQRRMLELEALQLSQAGIGFEKVLEDPQAAPQSIDNSKRDAVRDWLVQQPGISDALLSALGAARSTRPIGKKVKALDQAAWTGAGAPAPPARRRLRVFARDPLAGQQLETVAENEAVIALPWEELEPGPCGEYLEVIDIDPASGFAYSPIDLDHPHLLVQDGAAPSEASPQFHQQMVYAVAMKTIGHFERALGRRALWSPREVRKGRSVEHRFVRRLRIYPHALRERNAYYSSRQKALLFGYFPADQDKKGRTLPGGMVFTALSHDIIAHEATHALLDGLHRRFQEPSNRDVLAFHEAFADLVALFQHFTLPKALRSAVAKARGDLRAETELGQLAVEFGLATGRFGALRSAIGAVDDGGRWIPHRPTTNDYRNAKGPHALGAVLVAAVFDAFLNVYALKTRDLLRLATGGTGILPDGELSVDLVNRLAEEAAKIADHVLNICIRALDYCPPVDINFGDYLRAMITAEHDVAPEDEMAYRVALISAFRDRGIYPEGVRNLSVEAVLWEAPWVQPEPEFFAKVIASMSLGWSLEGDRVDAFKASLDNARKLHAWLVKAENVDFARSIGLDPDGAKKPRQVGELMGSLGGIEVHSVRPARRITSDGRGRTDLVVEVTQSWRSEQGGMPFRGGATLIIDLDRPRVRYAVRKRVAKAERVTTEARLRASNGEHDLAASYWDNDDPSREPFALLHRRGVDHG